MLVHHQAGFKVTHLYVHRKADLANYVPPMEELRQSVVKAHLSDAKQDIALLDLRFDFGAFRDVLGVPLLRTMHRHRHITEALEV